MPKQKAGKTLITLYQNLLLSSSKPREKKTIQPAQLNKAALCIYNTTTYVRTPPTQTVSPGAGPLSLSPSLCIYIYIYTTLTAREKVGQRARGTLTFGCSTLLRR